MCSLPDTPRRSNIRRLPCHDHGAGGAELGPVGVQLLVEGKDVADNSGAFQEGDGGIVGSIYAALEDDPDEFAITIDVIKVRKGEVQLTYSQ
jgi:hypothetical protein